MEATGSGLLARRLMGKRVAINAGPPKRTWQQYTVMDATRAVVVPSQVDDHQAAMYLVNPLSSYGMVKDVLKVQPGRWLMLSGAGSALSQMVIRMSSTSARANLQISKTTRVFMQGVSLQE